MNNNYSFNLTFDDLIGNLKKQKPKAETKAETKAEPKVETKTLKIPNAEKTEQDIQKETEQAKLITYNNLQSKDKFITDIKQIRSVLQAPNLLYTADFNNYYKYLHITDDNYKKNDLMYLLYSSTYVLNFIIEFLSVADQQYSLNKPQLHKLHNKSLIEFINMCNNVEDATDSSNNDKEQTKIYKEVCHVASILNKDIVDFMLSLETNFTCKFFTDIQNHIYDFLYILYKNIMYYGIHNYDETKNQPYNIKLDGLYKYVIKSLTLYVDTYIYIIIMLLNNIHKLLEDITALLEIKQKNNDTYLIQKLQDNGHEKTIAAIFSKIASAIMYTHIPAEKVNEKIEENEKIYIKRKEINTESYKVVNLISNTTITNNNYIDIVKNIHNIILAIKDIIVELKKINSYSEREYYYSNIYNFVFGDMKKLCDVENELGNLHKLLQLQLQP